jgi:DNA-binding GntR family transcriptional regulator
MNTKAKLDKTMPRSVIQADAEGSPIEKQKRWTSVYEAIRTAILAHHLSPGTKLPEDELGEIYAVSRTVVRSALQALAHDRLVQLEPNRGAFIAKPTKTEAREVFEARSLIEPRVCAMAAEVASAADIKRLTRQLEAEKAAIANKLDGEAVLLSAKFHTTIAEIAGQSILTEYVRDLCSRSSLIVSIYWQRHDVICESHSHKDLVDAIATHDTRKASALMLSHLVDLLSGLNLSAQEPTQRKLADILKPR